MLLPIIFFPSELGNPSGWLPDADQQFLRPQSITEVKGRGKIFLNITLDKISKCFTVFLFFCFLFLSLSHKRFMGYHRPARQVRGQATWTPKFVNGIICDQSNVGVSN